MHQLTANHRPCGVTVTGWPEESQLMTSDDILRIARAVKQMAINQSPVSYTHLTLPTKA